MFDTKSAALYIGRVKLSLHGWHEAAMSYDEKGTWVYLVTSAGSYAVYLGFTLWAVAGYAIKLVAYRRGL
jgi:hypothetical protein